MSDAAAGRGFASDNHAGAHPEVLAAIEAANSDHANAYGDDPFTERADEVIRGHLGPDAVPYFVFNGTAANVLAIDAATQPYEAVICTEIAHLSVDECGAPERIAGVKLLPVAAPGGKLDPESIGGWDAIVGDEHASQPKLVSISQASEVGTVYTPKEITAIVAAAHERDMYVHIDGSRLANAAAHLDLPLAAFTTDVGVDVVSLGGTKNGLVLGEAVVFLRPELAENFKFKRKQGMQLASKMRFIAAQFEALFGGELWLEGARHANAMARRLHDAVAVLDGVEVIHPVEANGVFAKLPRQAIDRVLSDWPYPHPFYVWNEAEDVVRWMCAWDTRPEDVDAFAAAIAAALD